MLNKVCSKCKIEKSLNNFNKRSDTGKPKWACKECEKSYNKNYVEENKKLLYLRNEQWRRENPYYQKEYYSKDIEKHKEYGRKHYQNNKTEILVKRAERYDPVKAKAYFSRPEVKEKQWSNHIKRTYGVDATWYYNKLKSQNNQCFICKTENPKTPNGKFCIDHCHDTGKIRNLLCKKCNSFEGFLKQYKQMGLLEKFE